MIHLSTEQTRFHLPFHRLIEALRDMFKEGCIVPPRHVHTIGDNKGTVLIMPAWRPNKRMGVKTITIYHDNVKLGLPGLHATYNLFDANTGVPLCDVDGIELTARRTAAASALGASFLARADASKYLIVGAGRVASLMAEAMAAVRPIASVQVWNLFPQEAENLVKQLREKGFDATHAKDLQTAVEKADIITCATLSKAPLVKGEWLRPGAHLDLIGSFTPDMCETDVNCFKVASVYTDTDEALIKSGDVLNAIKAGTFVAAKDHKGTLEKMCRGQGSRKSNQEITLFKSVGTALEDLAAAELVYDGAQRSKM